MDLVVERHTTLVPEEIMPVADLIPLGSDLDGAILLGGNKHLLVRYLRVDLVLLILALAMATILLM